MHTAIVKRRTLLKPLGLSLNRANSTLSLEESAMLRITSFLLCSAKRSVVFLALSKCRDNAGY